MPPLEQCGECVEMAAIAYAVFGAFLDAYHESLRAEFPLSVAFFPAMTEDCSLQVRTGADPPGQRRRPSGDVRAPRICPCPCRQTLPGAQARKYKISENQLRVCASSGGAFRTPNNLGVVLELRTISGKRRVSVEIFVPGNPLVRLRLVLWALWGVLMVKSAFF